MSDKKERMWEILTTDYDPTVVDELYSLFDDLVVGKVFYKQAFATWKFYKVTDIRVVGHPDFERLIFADVQSLRTMVRSTLRAYSPNGGSIEFWDIVSFLLDWDDDMRRRTEFNIRDARNDIHRRLVQLDGFERILLQFEKSAE